MIIEVNTSIPSYRSMHDVVKDPRPPARHPILINRVDDRYALASSSVWHIHGMIRLSSPDSRGPGPAEVGDWIAGVLTIAYV